jgi:1-acyl-sn-glycerol-3-phosphate acyltransferase
MSIQGQTAGEMLTTRPKLDARHIAWPSLASSERPFYGQALYTLGRSLVAAYMGLLLDVDIQRDAPLPKGPKILAANHPTTTDPLYLLTLLSEPVSILTTAASFDVPGVGAYLRATGHVPAVRGSGGATVEAVVRKIEAGRSVAIFPEGALSPLAGGFHRPHSGVARAALCTGAPVIPVGIGLQRDRIHVIEAEVDGDKAIGHLYSSGPYAMTVGRPLTFAGDIRDQARVRAVAGTIMHHIRDLAHESQRRIERLRRRTQVPCPPLPGSLAPAGKTSPGQNPCQTVPFETLHRGGTRMARGARASEVRLTPEQT